MLFSNTSKTHWNYYQYEVENKIFLGIYKIKKKTQMICIINLVWLFVLMLVSIKVMGNYKGYGTKH